MKTVIAGVLDEIRQAGLYKEERILSTPQGARVAVARFEIPFLDQKLTLLTVECGEFVTLERAFGAGCAGPDHVAVVSPLVIDMNDFVIVFLALFELLRR